ncbi:MULTISPECIES: acetolactate synthase large subunit [Bacillus amyloliquefaciens group]|uniref:acetolactate synthase large subunit n=1 Tax=Bacillus amyloliquefaciens group TaxID=1938374 RepID=UPI0002415FF8|nr:MULTISPECIES: acetolactate synthase large subunit [Bacillus amyloliquefaciens group]AGF26770.1 acetolactate synthase catalytic subunit [Bacillus amyloliquefaciens IT-45]AMP34012.1 acetolactate synthase catalytic subunit [Bacillus amyloliquefaciens]MBH5314229.1 acetolactate synthase large subunit [Bacillus velezensis]MDQ1917446.1 acetolactate synthase large subunit [Bacillus velezensis]QPV72758.1 acetolactate synthase large subunit [Bacillus velezensis]
MGTNVQADSLSADCTKTMNGALMLIESLKKENVEMIFGYPGGAVLPIYDKLYQSGLVHILPRHEQGAIHAAEGYARVSGKPGVVIATSGPGATNLVTGLADAMIDSLPLVVFTGQVATSVIGSDAFQEADILGITMPITKHSYQVRRPEDLPRVIKEAFHIATTGRPGPVLIDIPKDVAAFEGEFRYDHEINLPGYQPVKEPNYLQIRKLVEAVSSAKKPVILAGAGVLHGKASEDLKNYAEQQQIPVAHTLLGLGGFPADHPLFLGMAGMHGTYTANMALYHCDLLISIGARFDDRVTGNLKHFAKSAKVAHIDIDPAEIGKIIETQIPVVGDSKIVLQELLKQNGKQGLTEEWKQQLSEWKEEYPLWYTDDREEGLKPQKLIEYIHQFTNGEAIVATDVGQHQMWAAQFYPFRKADKWVTSGGLGTMGFGLPAAIGAQLADRNATVVAILGDGGFQMTLQELDVIRQLNLPVKVVILNNECLGMVRQWQEIFYEERYSESKFSAQPDFVKLSEAYGIKGVRISSEEEAEEELKKALSSKEPAVIDVRVAKSEKVFPMIAPGKGLHEMVGVKP